MIQQIQPTAEQIVAFCANLQKSLLDHQANNVPITLQSSQHFEPTVVNGEGDYLTVGTTVNVLTGKAARPEWKLP